MHPYPSWLCRRRRLSHSQSYSYSYSAKKKDHSPSKEQGRIGIGNFQRRLSLVEAVGSITNEVIRPFESKIAPNGMRQLALVAHNHMKPAMKEFIQTYSYSEILKKFRITGTQTTMAMCKSLWKEDPSVEYGKTCTSGPLGGDAQIAALMCMEDLGGIIFFVDPLSSHPHQADIDSLLRLANCGNIVVCPNPASAISMMYTLRAVLLEGDSARGLVPSFFETMESPAVTRYKHQQAVALANMIKVKGTPPSAPVTQSAEPDDEKKVMEVGEGESERPASFNFKDDMKEAPSALDQGVRRKTTKAPRALSGRAIDRALMGESMVFGADLQAMLLSELNDKDTDYSKEDEEEEEDDDAAAVAPTSATVPIVDHDHVVMKRNNTLDYSGHLLNPAMDLSAHPRYHTMDYSTHSNLRSVEEFGDEDDDSLEGEEDVEVSAPIATTTANTNTNTLARFKSSSSMSKGKGKGRMGVKNLCQKVVRRMTISISSGQKQERPFIVTAAATTPTPGESVLEREKFDLESEMIMLALKQQMELIEMLKNRH